MRELERQLARGASPERVEVPFRDPRALADLAEAHVRVRVALAAALLAGE